MINWNVKYFSDEGEVSRWFTCKGNDLKATRQQRPVKHILLQYCLPEIGKINASPIVNVTLGTKSCLFCPNIKIIKLIKKKKRRIQNEAALLIKNEIISLCVQTQMMSVHSVFHSGVLQATFQRSTLILNSCLFCSALQPLSFSIGPVLEVRYNWLSFPYR